MLADASLSTIILSAEQEQCAAKLDDFMTDATRRTFVVHGLAGTGKTTLLAYVAQQFPSVALVTLTGKAASVLRRKHGLPARTIHSFFYHLLDVQRAKAPHERDKLHFEHEHDRNALGGQLVLLDECSMSAR